ncbi:MAG: hypothetical protein ACE5Z5_07160 [Candidatus Bathyarchaeia archaeon]
MRLDDSLDGYGFEADTLPDEGVVDDITLRWTGSVSAVKSGVLNQLGRICLINSHTTYTWYGAV